MLVLNFQKLHSPSSHFLKDAVYGALWDQHMKLHSCPFLQEFLFCSVDSHTSLPLKFQAEPHTGNLKQICVPKTVALDIGFIFNIGGSKKTSSLSFIQKDMRTLSHLPTGKKFCILLFLHFISYLL